MAHLPSPRTALCLAVALASASAAQAQNSSPELATPSAGEPAAKGLAQSEEDRWYCRAGWSRNRPESKDHRENLFMGGIELIRGDLRIQAENAVVVLDEQAFHKGLSSQDSKSASGLPRRGAPIPSSRRSVDEAVLRQRLNRFFSSSSKSSTENSNTLPTELELFRSLYLEGNIVITQGDLIVARASSIYFSAIDNRVVFNDVELRLQGSPSSGVDSIVVIRGKKLVRQGIRTTGRDLSVTTCPAGKPHFEILAGEVEMIEEPDQMVIKSKSNRLAFSGVKVFPLPSLTIRTGEENHFPLKGASAGYSQTEGWKAKVTLGDDMNAVGQGIHDFFGRPDDEFRGDWTLGLGYNQSRGYPIDAQLNYGVEGMYKGRSEGFWLEDSGDDIREIINNLDGSPITETNRHMFRTENRLEIAKNTTLDLALFQAGDAAVYSEFHSHQYLGYKIPETSAYLRNSGDTYLATAGGRWNLTDFSYKDNRSLATSFVEHEPSLSFDWYSEPMFTLPGDHPVLVTSTTNVDQLKSNFDKTVTNPIDDRTVRLNQEVEVAVPLYFGAVNIRPFASGRITHYDNSPTNDEQTRVSFDAGVSLGTRLDRTWKWFDDNGDQDSFRHVLSPTVSFIDRTVVEGDRSDFFQFDKSDALESGSTIRVGLLQRFQHRTTDRKTGSTDSNDFFWLDLAQNFKPNADRDNGGEQLGLTEFEAILRPSPDWVPVGEFQFLVEGEHSWLDNRLRTFNTFGLLHAIGINWFAEYRTDITERGTVGYGVNAPIRRRWAINVSSQYNLTLKENNNYAVSLSRQDHDWRVQFGINYDNISGDTSFQMYFEPTFGGLFTRTRHDAFSDYGNGAADFTRY